MNTETMPESARLTADVVLFGQRDGALHVLLIRRRWAPFEDCWALPGGHVDPGEHTHAAAHRELAEETGIRLTRPVSPFAVYADPGRDPRGRYVTFAYTSRLADTPAPTAADDAADARWLPVDQALSGPLAFDHGRIIRDALRLVL
jgi:8-oxo-dGTP diphosphatase